MSASLLPGLMGEKKEREKCLGTTQFKQTTLRREEGCGENAAKEGERPRLIKPGQRSSMPDTGQTARGTFC